MKRELAFALEARSLILESVGKTRSNRALSCGSNGVSGGGGSRKRLKRLDLDGGDAAAVDVEVLGVPSLCEEGNCAGVRNGLMETGDVVIGVNNALFLERNGDAAALSKDCSVGVLEACSLSDGKKEETVFEAVIENGGGMEKSIVNKEVSGVNGEFKTPAEKPSRRFTRSVLKVNNKDAEDPLIMETDMIANVDEENVVALGNDDFNEGSNVDETKMVIPIAKIPVTVKALLETGILEGCGVYYNGGKQGPQVRGIVNGVGILCSCDSCRGGRVVPPSQFEIHAFKSYRRAAQYICFENGRSFMDILHLCRGTERNKLESTIRNAISPLTKNQMVACRDCKESCSIATAANKSPLCKSCTQKFSSSDNLQATAVDMKGLPQKGLSSSPRSIQMAKVSVGKAKGCQKNKMSTSKVEIPNTSPEPARKRTRIDKPNQPPSSCKSPEEGSAPRNPGKITKKDIKLHRLVFDEDGLPDGTELGYFGRGEKVLDGYKKDAGIYCSCCNEVVSASQFEAHAGFATRRKPYSYIYTSNGVSLHELAMSLLKSRGRTGEDSDDLCAICGDGGDLLLCDGCPRAFHLECASLTIEPQGDWFCRYCQNAFIRDKYVERNANALAAGRVLGVDLIQQINNRSIRIVKDFQEDASSCYLCREVDFSKSDFGPRTILICDQCEKEYHVGCLKTHNMADLEELPQGEWFCNTSCQLIRSSLQNLLNQGAEKLPNNLLDAIRDKLRAQNTEIPTDFDASWMLLNGQVSPQELENTKPFLSQAISILHEGSGTIGDEATGRDLIPSIVYGRKVRNLEFRGMYCAVLLVNSLVVSVAVFRLFGQELVELPLVATRGGYCGKGYFQALFGCIERLFASFNAKSIVLPAADGAEGLWLKFGFKRMSPDQVAECKKTFWQITQFAGVLMLEKPASDGRVVDQTENAHAIECRGVSQTEITQALDCGMAVQTQSAQASDGPIVDQTENTQVSDGLVVDQKENAHAIECRGVNQTDITQASDRGMAVQTQSALASDCPIVDQTENTQVSDCQMVDPSENAQVSERRVVDPSENAQNSDCEVVDQPEIAQISDCEVVDQIEIAQVSDCEVVDQTEIAQVSDCEVVDHTETVQVSDCQMVDPTENPHVPDRPMVDQAENAQVSDCLVIRQIEISPGKST